MNPTFDYPRFELGDALTAEQLEHFQRWGFLHFSNFIAADRVQELIAATQRVENRWIDGGIEKVNGVPIKYGRDLDGRRIVQRFAFANLYDPLLADFLKDPRFKLLFALIGSPDARVGANEKDGLVVNHYVHGPHSEHSRLGWHTDGLRDIFLGSRLNPLLNVGVHLSELGIEHGGLRLLPGTHRQSLWQFLFRKRYFRDHDPDADELAIIPAAGDLTVHDGRLWHRVAQSTVSGEPSRRRVMYIPVISGAYAPKHEKSATPLYQRLARFAK
ncbi:MAG: Phytanoyl-CoA dioxygenase [Hydrocarboniphaga sp.]|uniref:phytanoyl-CoA dioxygenase family protein n=1 Tax=Hydrocarboniphaga sp. TaxID=2033016 RepID=UPI00260C1ED3|nr:phytanoyl-CoA dioxygenase family protein [Hydrocarboniphaga sp.]MDB5970783.1 Phytanoyl-CoA dioxygenase [Hydrocarboniphaga sp.]